MGEVVQQSPPSYSLEPEFETDSEPTFKRGLHGQDCQRVIMVRRIPRESSLALGRVVIHTGSDPKDLVAVVRLAHCHLHADGAGVLVSVAYPIAGMAGKGLPCHTCPSACPVTRRAAEKTMAGEHHSTDSARRSTKDGLGVLLQDNYHGSDGP